MQLLVLSGSENQSLEPLLKEFSSKNGIDVEMKYSRRPAIMNKHTKS